MPGPWPSREAQRRETRERLVGAAAELVRRDGVPGLTVERVTDAAAVNRTTFYLHFTGRSELALAVGSKFLVLLAEHTAAWDSARRPTQTAARRWAAGLLDLVRAERPLVEVLEHAVLHMPEASTVLRDGMAVAVLAMPRSLARKGDAGAERAAAVLWSSVRSCLLLETQRGLLQEEAVVDVVAWQWWQEFGLTTRSAR